MDHLIEVESDMQDWDIDALVQVVFLCIEKKRSKLGLAILNFAIKEYPKHYEFYHLEGCIYAKMGDNSKALESFLKEEDAINGVSILEKCNEVEMYDITDNLLSIATCYLHAFQSQQAYSYLNALIDKYGDNKIYTVAQAYYLRAVINRSSGNHSEAKEDISKACAILCFIKILPGFVDELELERNIQTYLQT
jgi:tetratricopeptide (TPR) repeat protein